MTPREAVACAAGGLWLASAAALACAARVHRREGEPGTVVLLLGAGLLLALYGVLAAGWAVLS